MDIQSVTSSLSTYTKPSAPVAPPPQTESVQQVKKPPQSEPQPAEPPLEAPKPVTNTAGQQTGTLINVTA